MSIAVAARAALRLHPDDNVAVATRTIPSGATVDVTGHATPLLAREPVEMGHKIALQRIAS
jgi:hypothetical protein